jgi:hypothetical protein
MMMSDLDLILYKYRRGQKELTGQNTDVEDDPEANGLSFERNCSRSGSWPARVIQISSTGMVCVYMRWKVTTTAALKTHTWQTVSHGQIQEDSVLSLCKPRIRT